MFGIRGKLVSTKQKMFKMFRSIDNLGNKDPAVSPPNLMLTNAADESVNSLTNHASEMELRREQALLFWHELREAEALLHWRNWFDQPR